MALLLPLSGRLADLGNAMSDAAQMAMFDLADRRFTLMPIDDKGTVNGATDAATQAVAQGAQLILGPLLAPSVRAVAPIATSAGTPVVAFSSDRKVTSPGVYILGFTPEAEVERIIGFAARRGSSSIRRAGAGQPLWRGGRRRVAQGGGGERRDGRPRRSVRTEHTGFRAPRPQAVGCVGGHDERRIAHYGAAGAAGIRRSAVGGGRPAAPGDGDGTRGRGDPRARRTTPRCRQVGRARHRRPGRARRSLVPRPGAGQPGGVQRSLPADVRPGAAPPRDARVRCDRARGGAGPRAGAHSLLRGFADRPERLLRPRRPLSNSTPTESSIANSRSSASTGAASP